MRQKIKSFAGARFGVALVLLAGTLLVWAEMARAQMGDDAVISTQGTQFVRPDPPPQPKEPEPPPPPVVAEPVPVAPPPPPAVVTPPEPAGPPPRFPSVVILLDTSDSMLNRDSGKGRTRLEDAKSALVAVVQGMSSDTRIQMWVFNSRLFPISIDGGSARSFIPIGRPGLKERFARKIGTIRTGGSTNLYRAIIKTLDIFAAPADQALYRSGQRFPVLVIISDGEDAGKTGHSLNAVLAARKRFPLVTINTIGFHVGGKGDWFKKLCRIATSPKGCATASDPERLQAILESFYQFME